MECCCLMRWLEPKYKLVEWRLPKADFCLLFDSILYCFPGWSCSRHLQEAKAELLLPLGVCFQPRVRPRGRWGRKPPPFPDTLTPKSYKTDVLGLAIPKPLPAGMLLPQGRAAPWQDPELVGCAEGPCHHPYGDESWGSCPTAKLTPHWNSIAPCSALP